MTSTEKAREMLLSAPPDQSVVFQIMDISANAINLDFHTPGGNNPNDNGNMVFLWQSTPGGQWQMDALKQQAIPTNTPSGSVAFDGLSIGVSEYLVGYSVGPTTPSAGWSNYANVVATATIPAAGNVEEAKAGSYVTNPSIAVTSIGATSLIAAINLPTGYNPVGSGTYAAIWEGGSAFYGPAMPPKWVAPSSSASANGTTIAFNNILPTRGTLYTIALFATGYSADPSKLTRTAMAATHSFVI
ncbi:hypothetical protein [Falsiphaeobacter marinintestinus]|uniref:hypothetical protein n=1 Tax=Falsiphaeobacter marinintestinus TaxID=1492905 RepID=UPI0011B43825|nr:hypothetical protein [Phaeobacter marinintestinus]